MKGMLFGGTGLCVCGAAYFGYDGADFDRVVKRPPMEVYAAFSALAPEGVRTEQASDVSGGKSVTLRVVKARGQSLLYEISFADRPVVTAELTFEPAGEDGRQTHMTAELELDEYELGSAFETDAGMALSLVPEGLIDMQFANFMEDMVRDVEAGRPLPPLAMHSAGVRRADSANLSVRRSDAELQRRQASRPVSTARPMVDPNQAAERYKNGTPSGEMGRPDDWGR